MIEVNVVEIDTIARVYQTREIVEGHTRYCIVTPFQHYGVGTLVRFGNKLLTCTKIERMTLYHAAQTYFKECGYASENEFKAAWRANIAPFIACLDVIAHVFTPIEPEDVVNVASKQARVKFLEFLHSLDDVARSCGFTESEKSVESMRRLVKELGFVVAKPEDGFGLLSLDFRVTRNRNSK